MPMPMEFEAAWAKLIQEKVNINSDLVVLTKDDIESVTGNELRLMTKVDFSQICRMPFGKTDILFSL